MPRSLEDALSIVVPRSHAKHKSFSPFIQQLRIILAGPIPSCIFNVAISRQIVKLPRNNTKCNSKEGEQAQPICHPSLGGCLYIYTPFLDGILFEVVAVVGFIFFLVQAGMLRMEFYVRWLVVAVVGLIYYLVLAEHMGEPNILLRVLHSACAFYGVFC